MPMPIPVNAMWCGPSSGGAGGGSFRILGMSDMTAMKNHVDGGYVPNTLKGVANGIATLDSSGDLVATQIPAIAYFSLTGLPTLGTAAAANTTAFDASGAASTVQTSLINHATLIAAHGVAGSVVGTSDSQVLTNKTISGGNNFFSAIPESSVTNLVNDLASIRNQSIYFAIALS